jgi:hypothetical protein
MLCKRGLLQLTGSDPMLLPGNTTLYLLFIKPVFGYWEDNFRVCLLPEVLAVTDNRVSGQHLTETFCLFA